MPNAGSIAGGEKRGKAAGSLVRSPLEKKNVRAPPAGWEQRYRPAG